MKKIVLAGGCFWGVEEFLSRISGVINTEVGYANGRTENPTYEDVCYKNTYFAEVCTVEYDDSKVTLETLLKEYWSIVDPTTLNRQGPDLVANIGLEYTIKMKRLPTILRSKEENQKNYDKENCYRSSSISKLL